MPMIDPKQLRPTLDRVTKAEAAAQEARRHVSEVDAGNREAAEAAAQKAHDAHISALHQLHGAVETW